MRGVTDLSVHIEVGHKFQSTLPMRGVTVFHYRVVTHFVTFQSTLPMRGVTSYTVDGLAFNQFQSTLPMRGVTLVHTPLSYKKAYFNPHSPCGEGLLGGFLYLIA